MCFYVTHATWPQRATTCQERELTLNHIHTFLTTQGHGLPSRIRDQLNSGATSETSRTWWRYTSFTHPFILTRRIWKDDYDGQLIFGDLVGLKLPYILLREEEKPRKKPHSGNLSRLGIEPEPAAWQARMLPPTPQRLISYIKLINLPVSIIPENLCNYQRNTLCNEFNGVNKTVPYCIMYTIQQGCLWK